MSARALLLAAATLFAAAPASAAICTGISRIETRPGETVKTEQGPDFTVYRVTGAMGDWALYDGYFANLGDAVPRKFMQRGAVSILAVGAASYLAVDPHGEQNHFFGTLFRGGDADKPFFDRVTFGAEAKARCPAPGVAR
ncbi:MAG: hypothetical protein JOY99_06895 [Sphingomonadaceae bacterium]|nr:hypothetical protein [Sphingomonadaceae bacterium]